MELTRRGFFGAVGAAATGVAAAGLTTPSRALADDEEPTTHQTSQATVCPGCAAGCGVVCTVADGQVVSVAGDPSHPLSRGGLCARGAVQAAALGGGADEAAAGNPLPRVTGPLVRRPGATDWEPLEWDTALDEIADWVKRIRDESFVEKDGKATVNRCDGWASFGGARLTTEEQFALGKLLRSWGITRLDSEASADRAAGMLASAATIGSPSAAAPLSTVAHAQAVLSLGADPVLNPAAQPWIDGARAQGAPWIVVDDHFIAAAERADYFVAVRPGTMVAFLNGLMNYIIQNDQWQHEYVLNFTNASYVLNGQFGFDTESGLFSGWSADREAYDTAAWAYDSARSESWSTLPGSTYGWVRTTGVPTWKLPAVPVVQRDVTLRNPACVWQQLAHHVSRYDIETVAALCGTDAELVEQAYAAFSATGAPEQTGALLYGAGLVGTETAVQGCRAALMVQLLLGNLGMAGGAVYDLTGEANSQGALDMGLTPGFLPGYLPAPTTATATLKSWLEAHTVPDGTNAERPKALVSLMKEWWGAAATVENDYGFGWLPKASATATPGLIGLGNALAEGTVRGLFAWDADVARRGGATVGDKLASLEVLVATDAAETATTSFWRAPGVDSATVETTVYLLPSARAWDKEGVWVSDARWLQHADAVVAPPENVRSVGDIVVDLGTRVAERYEDGEGKLPEAVTNLKWDYRTEQGFSPRKVCWALNGYTVAGTSFAEDTVKLMRQASEIAADGTTACGALIYSGCWNNIAGAGDAAQQPVGRREIDDPADLLIFDHWGFSWPHNVRIAGNRGSCSLAGKPWNEEKTVVEWDGARWVQYDAADFPAGGTGERAVPDNHAFPQLWEQCGRLAAFDLPSGPLPEFYEGETVPLSLTVNGAAVCPTAAQGAESAAEPGAEATVLGVLRLDGWDGMGLGDERFSVDAAALAPENYVELAPALAAARGIVSGDKVRLSNGRGTVQARAWVTERVRPFVVDGVEVPVVRLSSPYSWCGSVLVGEGGEAVASVRGDGSTGAPAWQTWTVQIEKA